MNSVWNHSINTSSYNCNNYLQRKSKKGRRVVAREIDFDGDNEVSVTEDFLSSTSYTSEITV